MSRTKVDLPLVSSSFASFCPILSELLRVHTGINNYPAKGRTKYPTLRSEQIIASVQSARRHYHYYIQATHPTKNRPSLPSALPLCFLRDTFFYCALLPQELCLSPLAPHRTCRLVVVLRGYILVALCNTLSVFSLPSTWTASHLAPLPS